MTLNSDLKEPVKGMQKMTLSSDLKEPAEGDPEDDLEL